MNREQAEATVAKFFHSPGMLVSALEALGPDTPETSPLLKADSVKSGPWRNELLPPSSPITSSQLPSSRPASSRRWSSSSKRGFCLLPVDAIVARLFLSALIVVAGYLAPAATAVAQTSAADRFKAEQAVYPPWQKGKNNDAADRGLEFSVPPVDVLADFHGSLDNPQLVLYASGNYFFAMAPLVRAFGDAFPQYRGHVYYETLPPGLLLKQMDAGGTVTSGNMTWTVKPDVFLAERAASDDLVQRGRLVSPVVTFATNDLAIMVPADNPGHVATLGDLARPGLALAMPNPEFEGVARQIRASLVKAGGKDLAESVYGKKVRDGDTILTHIHHRQTPLLIMQHLVQAGVTWRSEAIFQEKVGNPISRIDIPAELNTIAQYSAAMVANAPHPEAARAWLQFIRSDHAFAAFEPYGFKRFVDEPE
jgi:molybdate transport system substrate-binding protein